MSAYVVYRRTTDGRLLRLLRLPRWVGWLTWALIAVGGVHLALHAEDFFRYATLRAGLKQAREENAKERVGLLAVRERLGGLRHQVDPVAKLNGKMAVLTNLVSASDVFQPPRGTGAVMD